MSGDVGGRQGRSAEPVEGRGRWLAGVAAWRSALPTVGTALAHLAATDLSGRVVQRIVTTATVTAPLLSMTLLSTPLAAQQPTTTHNTLTAGERAAGWELLFDGHTTDGWRGYMRETLPDGWQAVDGALTRVARAGDIITTRQFGDFELSVDWMVREGGNSGIFYRAFEGPERVHQGAPEMQILDDAHHADGRSQLTSAGANYALHSVRRGVVKPAGEWNHARILVEGSHVEHWLNGQKVVEYELGSEAWKALVAASKFAEWPEYGTAQRGHIGLQDHGNWVAFRNIKIRPIG